MFERISNGFAMAKSSWRVIMTDKKLLWFPVVSGILFLLVAASFIVPVGLLQQRGELLDANGKPHLWFYPVAFAFYFCTYFVIIFCNAALVSCALLRFNGQTPTLGDGFRAAMARLPQIFAWALVAATVGLLLKMIEQAHEKAGQIVAAILGTAWSVMTFFVVPILVVEKVGPFEAVGRSVTLMKKTWGHALAGNVGMGLFLFLLALPIVVLMVAGFMLLPHDPVIGGVLLVAGGIAWLWYMTVSAAMHTVFMSAVYQFATSERVPEGFEEHAMAHAFRSK
jgi:Family of unknown function (DUF6159)